MTLDKLKGDCGTLRAQDRDFAQILETLIFMDDSFKKQTDQKMKMKIGCKSLTPLQKPRKKSS